MESGSYLLVDGYWVMPTIYNNWIGEKQCRARFSSGYPRTGPVGKKLTERARNLQKIYPSLGRLELFQSPLGEVGELAKFQPGRLSHQDLISLCPT